MIVATRERFQNRLLTSAFDEICIACEVKSGRDSNPDASISQIDVLPNSIVQERNHRIITFNFQNILDKKYLDKKSNKIFKSVKKRIARKGSD
ncbi:hypothetical protein RCL_jg6192.t1 [Rhizophagus clarus]|uniref:Uncharacterized protein n=1 Tax=Rhizophagus clarus TaxID=94130 RepID=A0A8H3QFQ6_9GLOM|nr:hypothetical protein RCL_jg6192.t1 [Rhizophagus clarus]